MEIKCGETKNLISEFKHDVYGKRQTAKMKLLPSLFSCMYNRVKLFVFAMNGRRRWSISVCFIYGLEEKNSKSEVIFAVCCLPFHIQNYQEIIKVRE